MLASTQTLGLPIEALASSVTAAEVAGLRYVHDEVTPGIERRRHGKGFRYLGPRGEKVDDEATLRRIRALAIPPAWEDVWICADSRGHVQATGRDAKGRKQYRYHASWREVRDAVKYDRMLAFAEALPRIRARVEADLQRPGMPREKVVAAVVRLLEESRMRVGNEEYRRKNDSYGLTTLENRHVAELGKATVKLRFRGKGGKDHDVAIHDRRVARVIRRCLDIPGQELFQFVDHDGAIHSIGSGDVNDYVREAGGGEFTAKDFRTWAGTLLAAEALRRAPPCANKRAIQRAITEAITATATRLGNTPTVCRKSYVHPAVVDAFTCGRMRELVEGAERAANVDDPHALSEPERFLVRLLRTMAEAAADANDLAAALKKSIARPKRRARARPAA